MNKTGVEIWITGVLLCALWFILGVAAGRYWNTPDEGGIAVAPAGHAIGSGREDGTRN